MTQSKRLTALVNKQLFSTNELTDAKRFKDSIILVQLFMHILRISFLELENRS